MTEDSGNPTEVKKVRKNNDNKETELLDRSSSNYKRRRTRSDDNL